MIGLERYIYASFEDYELQFQLYVGDFVLSDFILDDMGFPKDTTVELGLEGGFCRDYLCEIIWDLNTPPKTALRQLNRELKQILDQKTTG